MQTDPLNGVHPDLVKVIELAQSRSQIKFVPTEGVRSYVRQQGLVKAGSSHTMYSRHLLQSDGYGHAVDVVAVGDLDGDGDIDAQDRKHTWDPVIYTRISETVLTCAAELGVKMRWGGAFPNFFDGPHFELVI